ncbi:MAG: conjugal transfer protein TraF [Gammaproteobacteria bacterium]|nr:conjugal transfer protein TraF [Gammaproteobacteria bacterium]
MYRLLPGIAGVAICCTLGLTSPVLAGTTYGVYDARTLAMGGVSVASANNDNAQFYNAALLAFNDEIEERTMDSRIWLPLLVAQVSDSVIEIEEVSSDDLAQSMSSSIFDFNALPDAQTARAVVDATSSLEDALDKLDDEDLNGDLYVGMGLTEPGKFQGAGFFMGVRLLAGGRSTVSEADRAILAAYRDGLSFIASNGAEGAAHPELFDANGALINPNSSFDSTASATGVAITEIGVAMSKQLHVFGSAIAAGISFKVLDVETFEDAERIIDDRIDVDQNSETETNVNFDVGLVKEISDHWRIGFAVKDVIPHNYKTSLGTIVRLRPRPRMGASYQSGRLQIAADADLIQNEPLGDEQPTQEAAIGAEWTLGSRTRLRTGYRADIRGNRDGVVSLGAGVLWRRLVVDLAYAQGGDAEAAALQFGVAF